jgi:hypothetical protein
VGGHKAVSFEVAALGCPLDQEIDPDSVLFEAIDRWISFAQVSFLLRQMKNKELAEVYQRIFATR